MFNAALGKAAEKVADAASNVGILLLKTVESDAAMKDRATVAAILAHSTEADFTNYARKTGVTGTVTVDNTNDWTTISVPTPQTWALAGGATNNTLAKLVIFLDEGGTDATRIPLVALDCIVVTNGNDLIVTFIGPQFFKAA